MIITPLGHTEFLVDIENSERRNVRILVDSWLSDYAVGDLMERTVKVRLDPEKLSTLDAIYISHAHCDHFDPYTLISLYRSRGMQNSKGKMQNQDTDNFESGILNFKFPTLILPFTLRYLEGVISEYLPETEVKWLGNHEKFLLHGIEITGHMWSNPEITNEDDVMMLEIASEKEMIFAEIDTIPDPLDEDVQKSLYRVFTRRDYETACYISSRNALEGQIPYYDLSEGKRKAYRDQYIANQKEDIRFQYEKYEYEEYVDFPNIFTLPGCVRGFVGQGIAYPRSLSEELSALSLFPLDELVSIESDYAKNAGYNFPQKALIPGRQYKIENGGIETGRKECPIGELIVNRKSGIVNRKEVAITNEILDPSFGASRRIQVPENPGSFVPQDDGNRRAFASGPLFPRELSNVEIEEGKQKILEVLNSRFLPYWSASSIASLREALIKNEGVYRVELKVSVMSTESSVPVTTTRHLALEGEQDFSLYSKGQKHGLLRTSQGQVPIIFEYSTAGTGFTEVPYIEGMNIDEDYWLLDILDFLDGKQEMYSSFWHRLDPKKIYRLWVCLGANFCNNDLVMKKYRLHFERAKEGLTVSNFVEPILLNIRNS